MEIVRAKQNGEEKCFIKCEIHDFWFKGAPPLTTGCQSCWMAYFIGQRASMKPEEMDLALDILEAAVHHMAEQSDQGTFDFKFDPNIEIVHED